VLDVTEAGCIGVAMLAKALHSRKHVSEIAKQWVKPVMKIEPKLHDHYNSRFEQYRNLYHSLKNIYR
jgi:sugar (pentulose or hexulose) kinase